MSDAKKIDWAALRKDFPILDQQVHGKPLAVSLVTGEERRLAPGATHVASTVEMLDTRTPVDVAVIDEIQMLSDRDRGAAWTAAVCGAPARTVYLVGAPEARRSTSRSPSRRASRSSPSSATCAGCPGGAAPSCSWAPRSAPRWR